MYPIFPDAVQVPMKGIRKIVRGKVGWAPPAFYSLTLKIALWIYITHFCATGLSRHFRRVYNMSCVRKGELGHSFG